MTVERVPRFCISLSVAQPRLLPHHDAHWGGDASAGAGPAAPPPEGRGIVLGGTNAAPGSPRFHGAALLNRPQLGPKTTRLSSHNK